MGVFGMDPSIYTRINYHHRRYLSLTKKNNDKHSIITIISDEPYLICLVVKRRDKCSFNLWLITYLISGTSPDRSILLPLRYRRIEIKNTIYKDGYLSRVR